MTRVLSQPDNVPGDFYVDNDCCLSCGIPEATAPDLFGSGDLHCYVRKQPVTPQEIDRMVDVFDVQDVDCIRYRGVDRVIKIRLVNMGSGAQCDRLDAELMSRHEVVLEDRTKRIATQFAESAASPEKSIWQRLRTWFRSRN